VVANTGRLETLFSGAVFSGGATGDEVLTDRKRSAKTGKRKR
jgi:hypothetical protein